MSEPPAQPVSVLSLGEAVRRLQSPWALEDFATLTGECALVVDLPAAGAQPMDAQRVERVRSVLGQLACPSVAIVGGDLSPAASALVAEFDLVVQGASELESVLAAIRRAPQAGLALVQLLRHNEKLDVHEGLIAESLVYSVLQSGPEFGAWRRGRRVQTPRESSEPAVSVLREDDRLILSLNRPERHNAFSREIRDALVEGLQLASGDCTIRRIVLRGEGPSFCSGGDLDEFGSLPDPATAHVIRSTRNASRLLSGLAERTRAEVHGACIGAGVELPAFVGEVVADEGAFFELPEVGMGLVPGAGGSVSIPRRIGRQRTAEMAITGRRLDARTALAWGLVDELRDRSGDGTGGSGTGPAV